MKGLGMLTIIWGHIMLSGITHAVVYSFHIPLFFFISGMMFNINRYPSIQSFINRRIKSLLIPYCTFSLISWGIWAVYQFFFLKNNGFSSFFFPLFQTFIAQGSDGFLVHNVPLWFVSCLFVVEILYFIIANQSVINKIIICFLSATLGFFMTKENPFFDFKLLPWSIEVAMVALPFYTLGNELTSRFSKSDMAHTAQKRVFLYVMVVCCLFTLIGSYMNGSVSMGSDRLNNIFIFYITALAGITSVFIICCRLEKQISNPIIAYVQWLGENSFYAMVIHNPIKGIVIVILYQLLGQQYNISDSYVYALITFLITTFLTSLCIKYINNVKEKFNISFF